MVNSCSAAMTSNPNDKWAATFTAPRTRTWRPPMLVVEFAEFIFQLGKEPSLNGLPEVAQLRQSVHGISPVFAGVDHPTTRIIPQLLNHNNCIDKYLQKLWGGDSIDKFNENDIFKQPYNALPKTQPADVPPNFGGFCKWLQ